MIRAARKDANHREIADYLLAKGASVGDLSQVKRLCDIVVGYRGVTTLAEIKDGSKPPSARMLTDGEQAFHNSFNAKVYIIKDVKEAQQMIDEMATQSTALVKSGLLITI